MAQQANMAQTGRDAFIEMMERHILAEGVPDKSAWSQRPILDAILADHPADDSWWNTGVVRHAVRDNRPDWVTNPYFEARRAR
jgi:hypothetical protein